MNDGQFLVGLVYSQKFYQYTYSKYSNRPPGYYFFSDLPRGLFEGGGLFEGWSIGFFLENPKPNFQKVFE